MHLHHLHLPGLTRYTSASKIQDTLVQTLLASKSHPASQSAPSPTLLTAEFHPVYTCGRREIGTLSAAQRAHLLANGRAEFHEARRGGQTTFHGPGQMVAYGAVDLRRHGVTPRGYVHDVLEEAVVRVLAAYGIVGFRTGNPGVWTSEVRKIAAVGVHLRRNVSSHGVAVNVCTDLGWFERIVACGLEGMETTSFEREGVRGRSVGEVADRFAGEFARLIGVEGVRRVGLRELEREREGEGSRIDSSNLRCGNEPG